MYDQGIDRKAMEAFVENYLKSKYPEWDREKLIYKKYDFEPIVGGKPKELRSKNGIDTERVE